MTRVAGQFVRHPVHGTLLPIVGDETLVDPSVGTGAVKVTPAHDVNDFECGRRLGLPEVRAKGLSPAVVVVPHCVCARAHICLRDVWHRQTVEQVNLLNDDGTLNSVAGQFDGMDRFEVRSLALVHSELQWCLRQDVGTLRVCCLCCCPDRYGALVVQARAAVRQLLQDKGLYRGSKAHAMALGVCSRSGDVLEPMLKPQVRCSWRAAVCWSRSKSDACFACVFRCVGMCRPTGSGL